MILQMSRGGPIGARPPLPPLPAVPPVPPLPPLPPGVEEAVRLLCRDALLEHIAEVLGAIRSRGGPTLGDPGGTAWIDVLFASTEERAELLARLAVAAVRGEGRHEGEGQGEGGRC